MCFFTDPYRSEVKDATMCHVDVEAAPRARARSPGRCPKRPGAAPYRKTTLLRFSGIRYGDFDAV